MKEIGQPEERDIASMRTLVRNLSLTFSPCIKDGGPKHYRCKLSKLYI